MKKKILIVIPIYVGNQHHLDFTQETLDSIEKNQVFHASYDTFIICNHYVNGALYKNMMKMFNNVMRFNTKNSVASAWNMALKYVHQSSEVYDYVLFCNNDIVLNPFAIDNLLVFAETHKEFVLWTGAEHVDKKTIQMADLTESIDDHPHFSFFMVEKNFPILLADREKDSGEPFPGLFDENFQPAYVEDCDMHQRLLRLGLKAGITSAAKFYHYGSRTIKTDEVLELDNRETHHNNVEYFIKKWGFNPNGIAVPNDDPVRFKYSKPFNGNLPENLLTINNY